LAEADAKKNEGQGMDVKAEKLDVKPMNQS
jgi:hypothetical protein